MSSSFAGSMDAILGGGARGRLSNGYSIRAGGVLPGAARSIRLPACRGRSQGAELSSGSSPRRWRRARRAASSIAGPAGVGKTRLAVEAAQLAAARGCAVAWVRATRSAGLDPARVPSPRCCPPRSARRAWSCSPARVTPSPSAPPGAGSCSASTTDQLLDDASAALVHQLVAAGEAFAIVTRAAAATRCRMRCGRCGRTSCACSWSWRSSRATRSTASSPPGWADRSTAARVTAMWELTRGNAAVPARAGAPRRRPRPAGRGRRRVALARPRSRRGRGSRSSSTCGSTASARAHAACWSSWRSAARWSSGCSEPGEPAALEALERARARRAPHRRAAAVRRRRPSAARRGGARAPDADRASTRSTRGSPTRWRRAARVAAATCCGSRRGGWSRARPGTARCSRARPSRRWPRPTPVLAERLARAAVQEGGGFRAELALGRALAAAGRGPEADALFAGLATQARDDARARGGRHGEGAQPLLGRSTAPTTRTPCCRPLSGSCATTPCATS